MKGNLIIFTILTFLILVLGIKNVYSQSDSAKLQNLKAKKENFSNAIKQGSDNLFLLENSIENVHFLIPEFDNKALKLMESNNILSLKLISSQGEVSWENQIQLKGLGFDVKISDHSNRVVVYEYNEGSKRIRSVLDDSGEIIKEDLPYLKMSNSGSYFAPEHSYKFELFDANVDQINTSRLISDLGVNSKDYQYGFTYKFFEKDILLIQLTEFKKNYNNRLNRGNTTRSVKALIDLPTQQIVYRSDDNLNSQINKITREFYYHNNMILHVFTNYNKSNPASRTNIQTEVIDVEGGEEFSFASGPYVQAGVSKLNNSFFVSQRKKGADILTVKMFDIASKGAETFTINRYRRIKNIYQEDSKIHIQSKFDKIRYWSVVEEVESSGEIKIEYDGWLNNSHKGLVPISENELYFKTNSTIDE